MAVCAAGSSGVGPGVKRRFLCNIVRVLMKGMVYKFTGSWPEPRPCRTFFARTCLAQNGIRRRDPRHRDRTCGSNVGIKRGRAALQGRVRDLDSVGLQDRKSVV